MANVVHIIDGNNWFTKHYFTGMDNMTDVVARWIRFCNGHKGRIIFAFDTTKSARRLQIYPEYKAGRKTSLTPEQYEAFTKLMGDFRKLVKSMGYTVLCGHGYEADDYVAVTSRMLKAYDVRIYSTDHDFLQLVNSYISVIWSKPEGEIKITPDSFEENVGVGQEYFMDYKCMIGDKSDNIPGIEGIGEVTAKKYIDEYGHYNEILEALRPKLDAPKKKDQPNKTELKLINGENGFNIAKELIDMSINYKDLVLRDLIKKAVKETAYHGEACLEILSENDAESSFSLVKELCKTRRK